MPTMDGKVYPNKDDDRSAAVLRDGTSGMTGILLGDFRVGDRDLMQHEFMFSHMRANKFAALGANHLIQPNGSRKETSQYGAS